jgi:uncharacterized membrane protein
MMIDSMLTLTRRGAFWMATFFVVSVLLDVGISALVGQQEPMFLLFAAAILALFIVTATYTLAKKLIALVRRGSDKTPSS